MTNQLDTIEHFRKLLAEFDTAMLLTINPADGMFHGRPMRVEARHENNSDDLWFITSLDSAKIRELQHDERVCVVMMDGRRQLCTSGYGRVVQDRAKISELWHESLKLWFPDGPSDPQLVAIQVRPMVGEYWDNAGTKGIRFAFEAVKAWVKDAPIDQPKEGKQHGKVVLG